MQKCSSGTTGIYTQKTLFTSGLHCGFVVFGCNTHSLSLSHVITLIDPCTFFLSLTDYCQRNTFTCVGTSCVILTHSSRFTLRQFCISLSSKWVKMMLNTNYNLEKSDVGQVASSNLFCFLLYFKYFFRVSWRNFLLFFSYFSELNWEIKMTLVSLVYVKFSFVEARRGTESNCCQKFFICLAGDPSNDFPFIIPRKLK